MPALPRLEVAGEVHDPVEFGRVGLPRIAPASREATALGRAAFAHSGLFVVELNSGQIGVAALVFHVAGLDGDDTTGRDVRSREARARGLPVLLSVATVRASASTAGVCWSPTKTVAGLTASVGVGACGD
jgi:hypothetical protein